MTGPEPGETEEQMFDRFQAELQELVDRYATATAVDPDVQMVVAPDWVLAVGATSFDSAGKRTFVNTYLASDSSTWALYGLLRQIADEIDVGGFDADE